MSVKLLSESAKASFAKLEPYATQSGQLIASRYAGLSPAAKRWLPLGAGAVVLLVFGAVLTALALCAGAGWGYWCRAAETVPHDA